MRIALTIERFDTSLGGEQVWVDGLARFLAKRNHDVHIVTFLDRSRDFPGTIHSLTDPGSLRARAVHVDEFLKTLAADVVHDSGTALKADLYQPACGSLLHSESRFIAASDTPLRVRAAVSPRAIWRRMQLRRMESEQMRNARKIVAASQLVADMMIRRYHIPRSTISIVHNGVETTRYDASRYPDTRDANRTQLNIGKEQTAFLMVANNLLLKGADVSIKALALLHRRGLTNARLIVAGGKPDRTIQRIVDETNSEVTFLGHVSDVGRLMRACDVFLHPTRWDTCSLVTSEAMASGLPVITSGMNGAAELISDGYDGLVCSDPEKIDVIADTMARLMDPALRRTIGDNAKRRIGTFDIQTNCAQIEHHLLELAERPR